MDPKFWLDRWNQGAIGFHMDRVSPQLEEFWPTLNLPTSARVLVPLCGKSLDMVWLAAQGYRVLGVELAPLAVEQFFAEHELRPTEHVSPMGRHYLAGNIEIICGDIFSVDAQTLSSCSGAFDRGALVALPPEMRANYVSHVYGSLAADYRGLLLTLEYDQQAMKGPPFSVLDTEVHHLFGAQADVSIVENIDILEEEPKFAARGLRALASVTWRLQGRR